MDAAKGLAVAALTADLLRRLDEQFLRSTMPRPLPPLRNLETDTSEALLFELNKKLERSSWLLEGPDAYDGLDVTVGSSVETRIDYAPFLVWGVSVLNTQPSGGDRVLLQFTDVKGKVKQVPILPNSSLDLDLKGGLGSVIRMVSQTTSVEVTGIVLLKWPLKDEYLGV